MQLGTLPRLAVGRFAKLSASPSHFASIQHRLRASAPELCHDKAHCGVFSNRTSSNRSVMADASASSSSPQQQQTSDNAAAHDPVIQYVVLRKDLWTEKKWPLGSVVAQACHASTAAMHMFRDDPDTIAYLQVRLSLPRACKVML
jgi:hypothetical protein